jgi:hypothetical protein
VLHSNLTRPTLEEVVKRVFKKNEGIHLISFAEPDRAMAWSASKFYALYSALLQLFFALYPNLSYDVFTPLSAGEDIAVDVLEWYADVGASAWAKAVKLGNYVG